MKAMLVAFAVAAVAPAVARAGTPIDVRGQAGAVGYPAGDPRVNTGSTYGVSVGFGGGASGFELGYIGADYGTDGVAGGGPITENGGQALIRTGPTLGALRPYLAAGYEVSWMNASNQARIARLAEDETLQKIPVGLGVDVHLGGSGPGVLLGVRGLYRFVFDSAVIGNGQGKYGDDQLSGTLVLGGGF
jgi:hypothetical protein